MSFSLDHPLNLLRTRSPNREFMRRIANRKKELGLFERMLRGQEARRILLIEGPSERGKSTLLNEFALLAEELPGEQRCARADLRGGLSLDALFSTFCAELGSEVLAAYSKESPPLPVQVNVHANM